MTARPVPIDLRSDTVTRPSRRDARGDGRARRSATTSTARTRPSTSCRSASRRCSARRPRCSCRRGTMANQVALRVLTRPGDDVVVSRESHAVWHETGGVGGERRRAVHRDRRAAGCSRPRDVRGAREAARPHRLSADDAGRDREHAQPRRRPRLPAGRGDARSARAARDARHRHLPRRRAPVERRGRERPHAWPTLAAPFDLVAVCLSKGLGAPGGSLLAGTRDADRARARATAACSAARCARSASSPRRGCYALDHHVERLADDHANARLIATRLAGCPGVLLDLATVATNIVVFRLAPTRRTPRPWSRGRGSAACSSSPSGRARCASSRISTSRGPSARRRRTSWRRRSAADPLRRGRGATMRLRHHFRRTP